MCSHETPQEAARCICTGYGFGDPPCRCGYLKSQHADGTGACMIPQARCHEYVLRLEEPYPVTLEVVDAATAAIMRDLGFEPLLAQRVAMSALFAGRTHALEQDWVIKSLRAQNDRLKAELAEMSDQLAACETGRKMINESG